MGMSGVNDLLRFYTTNLSNKFQRLSEVLKTTFGLDGFWYTYLSPEGDFFQIGNHPGVGETYFGNELHLENPFFCHPDNYTNNIPLITNDLKYKEFHLAQKKVQSLYGFQNFLCIPKKEGAHLHLFLFSCSRPDAPLNAIFLQNSFALSRFSDYFLSCWKKDFLRMENFTFNIGEILGKKFYSKPPLPFVIAPKEALCRFGKELGLIDRHVQIEQLTKRERECIELLLEGKTAPQIGNVLGLSKRTVFDYLDHVKLKVGALNKSELLEILHECKNLKIL